MTSSTATTTVHSSNDNSDKATTAVRRRQMPALDEGPQEDRGACGQRQVSRQHRAAMARPATANTTSRFRVLRVQSAARRQGSAAGRPAGPPLAGAEPSREAADHQLYIYIYMYIMYHHYYYYYCQY